MIKKLFILSLILFLGLLTSKITYKDVQNMDRIEYKVYVNGVASSSFPSKGNYSVSVSCTNESNIKWDYDNWKLSITLDSTDDCYVEFNSITSKRYISDYIKGKEGTTQGESSNKGQIVNENGYRYEGSDPYNYVLFNNELWRIIGVFDTTLADGSTTQALTKIIRNDSIGGYTYNSTRANYWVNTSGTRSSLNILLNDYYYQGLDGTNSGSCFIYSGISGNCNWTMTGINRNYREMVENVMWYLGAGSLNNVDTIYEAERGTGTYSGNATTSTGYVGLMYPSDYGYSVLASSCARTTSLSSYNTAACAGKAWMLKIGYEWMITPNHSISSFSIFLNGYGQVQSYHVIHGFAVRPVLYLKSTVYILNGDGSIGNPYIIAN